MVPLHAAFLGARRCWGHGIYTPPGRGGSRFPGPPGGGLYNFPYPTREIVYIIIPGVSGEGVGAPPPRWCIDAVSLGDACRYDPEWVDDDDDAVGVCLYISE